MRFKDVAIGTTQTIFGDTYEVVDRDSLIIRRDQGKDLTKMCVSNVTNMSYLFYKPDGFGQNTFRFNQPIGNWDVSSVTKMSELFMNSAGGEFSTCIQSKY